MQMEKEKQNYDFDNVQSQLDKALGQAARMQKEREAIQLEVDRLTDKYEKAQVHIYPALISRKSSSMFMIMLMSFWMCSNRLSFKDYKKNATTTKRKSPSSSGTRTTLSLNWIW